MKKAFFILCSSFFLLSVGCASNPDKIQTAYVSPLQYQEYNCRQIQGEMERVTRRAYELHGNLKKTADTDAAQMAVGMILFWPALFFLEGGDGPEAQEYARLKGERDMLEKVSIEKECKQAIIEDKPQTDSTPTQAILKDSEAPKEQQPTNF